MAGRLAVLVGLLVAAGTVAANELRVEPATIRANETATVTVELEGSLAGLDEIDLPLRGLAIEGGPSVSSQFEWINGRTSRRKIFVYRVRPIGPGTAIVGPLRLSDGDGGIVSVPAARVEILPGPRPLSPEASSSIAGSLAQGEGFALVAAVGPRRVFRGEQIDATWYLYVDEGQSAEGARVSGAPDLDGFWSEELDIGDKEESVVLLGDTRVRRIAIRRAALFPIRDGTLVIGPVEVAVRTMQSSRDPFGHWNLLERRIVDVRRSSPALEVVVLPVPEGWTSTGTYSIRCSPVRVPVAGPASFDVTVEGRGNLRAVEPPGWERAAPSDQEVEDLGITVHSKGEKIFMRRSWRYVLFPAGAGKLDFPPLSFRFFDPALSEGRSVSCGAISLEVPHGISKDKTGPASTPQTEESRERSPGWWIGVALAALGIGSASLLVAGRRFRRSPEWRSLTEVSRAPREARARIGALVESRDLRWGVLIEAPGDLGESFRALVSLVDLMEKEPWEIDSLQKDYRLRVSDFLAEID